jgi:hypothetical protein
MFAALGSYGTFPTDDPEDAYSYAEPLSEHDSTVSFYSTLIWSFAAALIGTRKGREEWRARSWRTPEAREG